MFLEVKSISINSRFYKTTLPPIGMTSITDVYLTSHIKDYINGFLANFPRNFDSQKLLFMQSDGGLTHVDNFSGCRSILSGPAGGVIGYAMTTVNDIGLDRPIIGFDMGGTSTDVSRYHGRFEHKFESKIADVIIQTPQLGIFFFEVFFSIYFQSIHQSIRYSYCCSWRRITSLFYGEFFVIHLLHYF